MNRPANGRAHLSIGEVLSLLQDEFPDVTISKIRFLESQGLLDPERTPSGYRKFYNADIERLRWILRQQKDHYLPLKVIKDRLDQAGGAIPADDDVSADGQQRLPETAEVEGGSRAEGRHRPAHLAEASGGGQYRNGSPVAAVETRPAAAPAGPPERWRDELWPDAAVDGQPAEATRPKLLPAPPPRPEPLLSRPEAAPAPAPPAPPVPSAQAEINGATAPMAPPDRPARPAPSRRQEPRRQEPRGPRRPAALAETPPSAPNVAVGASGDMADVSLSLEELAEASGLSPRDIRDLEAFGLIEPYDADDTPVYDGDALVVAHTAAGFLQHGIEPRHLRTYKVAMDREAGLFEQIVLPILKQRNPEARRRAARTVTELVRLGEVMRGVLLRRELRDHLAGGR